MKILIRIFCFCFGTLITSVFCGWNEDSAVLFYPNSERSMDNMIKIQTMSSVLVTTGFSICLKIRLHTWERVWLFYSSQVQMSLILNDFRNGTAAFNYGEFSVTFDLKMILSTFYLNWNSICLVYNEQESSMSIFINGFDIFKQTGKKCQNINNLSNVILTLGGDTFSGLVKDFNMWNRPLSLNEIRNFNTSCNISFLFNSKPELIYWTEANIIFSGNSTQSMSDKMTGFCRQGPVLTLDSLILQPYSGNHHFAEQYCNSLNGKLFFPSKDQLSVNLKSKIDDSKNGCSYQFWTPVTSLNSSTWAYETKLGNLETFPVSSNENKKVENGDNCIFYNFQTNKYYPTDCNKKLCSLCEIDQKRLIYTVRGITGVPCFLDNEYVLMNFYDDLYLCGIQGRTCILNTKEWNVMKFKETNESLILNGTTMYPVGLQTITCPDRNNGTSSFQLKISNASFFLSYSLVSD
jgi:hypothetical protein